MNTTKKLANLYRSKGKHLLADAVEEFSDSVQNLSLILSDVEGVDYPDETNENKWETDAYIEQKGKKK